MTIKEYLNQGGTFIPDYRLDEDDYICVSTDFHNLLDEYMYYNLNSLQLREMFLNADETPAQAMIQLACYNLFMVNRYKYEGLYKSTQLDSQYNPIENYSQTETITDTTVTHKSGTDINDIGSQTTNSTDTSEVSPYDVSSFVNDNKSTSNSTVGARSDIMSTEGNENVTYNHQLTRSGNIGVMTAGSMILEDRQVHDYNFLDVVAKDIVKLLTIRVY